MEVLNQLFASSWGPVLIFGLNAVNVTIMTMRQIVAVRGHRATAAGLGFVQMLFWLLAVGGALQHLASAWHVLGYASGYATGNVLGISLEQRLAIGTSAVQAIVRRDGRSTTELAEHLRQDGFAVTQTPARGWHGDDVDVLRVVVPRKKVGEVAQTVEAHDAEACLEVEDVKATKGAYPDGPKPPQRDWQAFAKRVMPRSLLARG